MAIPHFFAKEGFEYKPDQRKKKESELPSFKVKKGDSLPPPFACSYVIVKILPKDIQNKIADVNAKPGDPFFDKEISNPDKPKTSHEILGEGKSTGSKTDADTSDNNNH